MIFLVLILHAQKVFASTTLGHNSGGTREEKNKEATALGAIPLMDKRLKRKRDDIKENEYSLKQKKEKTSGYVCLTCGIKFHLQLDLNKHIKKDHPDITKPFQRYKVNKDKRKGVDFKRALEKKRKQLDKIKNAGKFAPLIEHKTKQKLNFGNKMK